MQVGRILRSLRSLRTLQVVSRPVHWTSQQVVRFVPSSGGPGLVSEWPQAPPALGRFVESERSRFLTRRKHLPKGSLLGAFEDAYGLDLTGEQASRWGSDPIAIRPFPAAVRARRLAVA